jgi:hypothetical protein
MSLELARPARHILRHPKAVCIAPALLFENQLKSDISMPVSESPTWKGNGSAHHVKVRLRDGHAEMLLEGERQDVDALMERWWPRAFHDPQAGRHRTFSVFSGCCLLLFVMAALLWVRSYRAMDDLSYAGHRHNFEAISTRGELLLGVSSSFVPGERLGWNYLQPAPEGPLVQWDGMGSKLQSFAMDRYVAGFAISAGANDSVRGIKVMVPLWALVVLFAIPAVVSRRRRRRARPGNGIPF